jgi:long-chain acyl-CoA synthetase
MMKGNTMALDQTLSENGFATLSVANILAESAVRHAARPAIHFSGSTITFAELWDQTRGYAAAFRARGIGRGSRVGLMAPNVPDFARAYYAAIALGAIVVPVHPLFKSEEIAHVLRDAGVDLFVVAAPFLAEAGAAAASVGVPIITVLLPEDAAVASGLARLEVEAAAVEPIEQVQLVHPLAPATILYTSGTTGTPKGAVSSHLSIIEQVHVGLIDSFELSADDVMFGGLPLFHTFGQTVVMNIALRRGASIVLLPRFVSDDALALMCAHRVTVLAAVPTMFIDLLEAAERVQARPPLRLAISGGAALPGVIHARFQAAFGSAIHEGYGLTETTPVVSFNPASEPARPGTAGRPIWGVRVAIAAAEIDDRVELLTDPEHIGEIVVQGHNLFNGYLGDEEATASTVVDGWFKTGDLGRLQDGILTVVDRKKDMVVRGGYNIYPTEVEQVMARQPGIASVCVFGVEHARHGQEVHAAVVLAPGSGLSADEIVAFAGERLAAFKRPREIHLIDDLPLAASGKVLRRALVARFSPADSGQL